MVIDEDYMTLAFDPTDISPPRKEGPYSLVVHKFAISEDKKTLTLILPERNPPTVLTFSKDLPIKTPIPVY